MAGRERVLAAWNCQMPDRIVACPTICQEIRESRLEGVEGIAPPPLGDLSIHDALAISDSFIANGGMTVHILEKGGADASVRIDGYTRELFASIGPNANRFLYSSGCNTSIRTPIENLKYWRDATWKHGRL